MKLYYLYVRDRRIPFDHALTDGHFDLLDHMVGEGFVDEARAVIDIYAEIETETRTFPNGLVATRQHGIADLDPQPGDVVWVRGAWRSWSPFVQEMQRRNIWLMFYDANTGRKSWPFWDVIVSDMMRKEAAIDRHGRLWLEYPKPVAKFFQPAFDRPRELDICIGASHIYDRKGQYRVYRAVLAYERMYGVKLKCALPGGFYFRERRTTEMQRELPDHPNITAYNWHLSRQEMHELYNRCRIFTHTASGGHGDRGPVEAGMCGCPLVIGKTKYHARYTFENPEVSWVAPDHDDPEAFAEGLHGWLAKATEDRRRVVAGHFRRHASVEHGAGPFMARLCAFFRKHPKADRSLLHAMLE